MKLIRIKGVPIGDHTEREWVVCAENVAALRSYDDAYWQKTIYQVLLSVNGEWVPVEREQYEAILAQMEHIDN